MLGEEEETPEEPDISALDQQHDQTLISTFQIKPGLEEKFKPQQAKEVIYSVLQDTLSDKTFPEDETEFRELVNMLATKIKQKCRAEMDYPKYKIIVNVVLGEQKGAGVSCASRCFWDADSDACVSNTFVNETIFCMAAVFAIYFY